jgi:hypothetical protein
MSNYFNSCSLGYEDVWCSGGTAQPLLTLALFGDDFLASRPGSFIFK